MQIRTRVGAVAATVALAGATTLMAVPAAQAVPTDLVCTGSQQVTFDPPVKNTPQTVTTHAQDVYNCSSLLTNISSGTMELTTVRPDTSCLLIITPPGPQTMTFHWNNGQSSTVAFTVYTTATAANNTFVSVGTGTVTSGLGVGALVTRTVAVPSLNAVACANEGISAKSSLAATLTVTGL
ncbi:hypothetical protein [Streptomyces sp. NPDC002644]